SADVLQPRGEAGQVANAVAVAIVVAARIDLVDHRPPPPWCLTWLPSLRLRVCARLSRRLHDSVPLQRPAPSIPRTLSSTVCYGRNGATCQIVADACWGDETMG